MSDSHRHRPSRRYVVPLAFAAATAAAVAVPQLAAGADHPHLPPRTAAQLLVSLENAKVPDFTGTVVETTRLGLPSLPDSGIAAAGGSPGGGLEEIASLLTGSHTAQLAYGGPERQRIAIFLNDLSETDIVHNGADVWTYSSQDNAVSHTHETVKPDGTASDTNPDSGTPTETLPGVGSTLDPQQAAEHALAKIDPTTAVTVDRTAQVAGRPAYQLVLRPRDSRSLVGSVRIAIDSATSLPLRVEIMPRTSTSPAFEVTFTSLHIGMPAASTFAFTIPPGAKVSTNPLAGPGQATAVHPGLVVRHDSQSAPGTIASPPVGVHRVTPPRKENGFRSIGKGWLRVLVGHASPSNRTGPNSPPSTSDMLAGLVQSLSSRVPQGRLVHTPLFSVLLTNDGRMFVGAVSPSYLEQLAASGAGR
jgi:outer membrane lipoprotein-sorting protein